MLNKSATEKPNLTKGWLCDWLDNFGVQLGSDRMTVTYSLYGGLFYLQFWSRDLSVFAYGTYQEWKSRKKIVLMEIEYGAWQPLNKENLNILLRKLNLDPIQ